MLVFFVAYRVSLVMVSRGYSLLPWAGLSCCRAQALGAWASVVMVHWLRHLWHVESSWTRDWTHVPELAGRFLTTKAPWKKPWQDFKIWVLKSTRYGIVFVLVLSEVSSETKFQMLILKLGGNIRCTSRREGVWNNEGKKPIKDALSNILLFRGNGR